MPHQPTEKGRSIFKKAMATRASLRARIKVIENELAEIPTREAQLREDSRTFKLMPDAALHSLCMLRQFERLRKEELESLQTIFNA